MRLLLVWIPVKQFFSKNETSFCKVWEVLCCWVFSFSVILLFTLFSSVVPLQYVVIVKIKKTSKVESTQPLSITCSKSDNAKLRYVVLDEIPYTWLVWKKKKQQAVSTQGIRFVTAICIQICWRVVFGKWVQFRCHATHSCQYLLWKRKEWEFPFNSRSQIKILWRRQPSKSNSE